MPWFGKKAAHREPKAVTNAILEQLSCDYNSSQQHPQLADAHNHFCKGPNGPRLHLLHIPSEIRANICKIVLDTPNFKIEVAADDVALSAQPSVTMICRDIREEVLPLFYREKILEVDVKDFDIRPYLGWYERAMAHDSPKAPVKIHFYIPPYVSLHFENLVHWLKLAHAGKVAPLDNEHRVEHQKHAEVIKGVFAVVLGMKDDPFSSVERMLPGIRVMLDAQDSKPHAVRNSPVKAQIQEATVATMVPVADGDVMNDVTNHSMHNASSSEMLVLLTMDGDEMDNKPDYVTDDAMADEAEDSSVELSEVSLEDPEEDLLESFGGFIVPDDSE